MEGKKKIPHYHMNFIGELIILKFHVIINTEVPWASCIDSRKADELQKDKSASRKAMFLTTAIKQKNFTMKLL
jgi:hypothetical protein